MPSHTIFPDSGEIERDHIEADFHYFDIDDELVTEILRTTNLPHRHDYEEIVWVRPEQPNTLDAENSRRSKTLVIVPQGHIHRLMPSLALEGVSSGLKTNSCQRHHLPCSANLWVFFIFPFPKAISGSLTLSSSWLRTNFRR